MVSLVNLNPLTKFYFISLVIHVYFLNMCFAQKTEINELNKLQLTPTIMANELMPSSSSTCSGNSEAYHKKYKQQAFYIPTKKSPLITVKITVHIFKPLADTGRWQMNDNNFNGLPALNYLLASITNGHQERYSEKRKASYTVPNFNSPYVADSKIQFEITNIYFYADLNLYTSYNDEALFNAIEKADPKRLEEGMPLVFNGSGGPGHLSNYKGNAGIVTTLQAYDPIFGRSHLLHEIGHAFGLGHTYVNSEGGGSDWQNFNGACGSDDYLSDVFPNNNFNCQNEGKASSKPLNAPCFSCYESTPDTSNNLMGGQRYNTWLSPLQMGRRIRSMHLNSNAGRNLRQYAKDTESNHKSVWLITENEMWDFDIQLYNDIVIKSNVTLTITCKLAMAINGKIKLENGAKLIIDGGEITSWCKTGKWQGVITPKLKKQKTNNTTAQPVFIELIHGGVINKAKVQTPVN